MNPTPKPACIFCDICEERLSASIVHRDERWLVFMDIHPIRQGHALIVPRTHLAHLDQLDDDARSGLMRLAARVMAAQEKAGYAAKGGNLLLNDGVAANQHVPHLHLHCIPRKSGDQIGFGTRLLSRTFGIFGRRTDRRQLDEIARSLSRHL
ncbi:MAG: HIT family protein [Lysobacter sp.]|nr:HIT family protein [Lysobacter sp.]